MKSSQERKKRLLRTLNKSPPSVDTTQAMISGVTSDFSSPIVFGQQQPTSIQYDHDHTLDEYLSSQPQPEKTVEASSSPSGRSFTKENNSIGEIGTITCRLYFNELSAEDKREIEELQERDQEVRRHEQAHLVAAGAYARGGPSFTYEKGPDGKMYAVGGEVPVDVSPIADNPQATIQKAAVLQRAALAPRDPSGADRQIAAKASAIETKARQELAQQSQETTSGGKKVNQQYQSDIRRETFSPVSGPQSPSYSPSSFKPDLSSYIQQKQLYSRALSGNFLNLYV